MVSSSRFGAVGIRRLLLAILAFGTTASITVTVSNAAALTAAFTSPTSGATLSGTSRVGVAASGTSGTPTTFTLAVDGTAIWTKSVNGTTATFNWHTTSVSNGLHTLTLTVRDGAGRAATATLTVRVSNGTTSVTDTPGARLTVGKRGNGSGMVGEASGAQLTASWVDNSNATATTKIERRLGTDTVFAALADVPPGVTQYADTSVAPGATYCYRAQAYDTAAASPYSNEACATSASTSSTPLSDPAIDCGTTCAADYAPDTTVTLTARPSGGSVFAGWSGPCAAAGSNPVCTITLSADVSVTADFRPAGVDFDGDGRADVAIHDVTTGAWWVGLSTGRSFAVSSWAAHFGTGGDAEDVFVSDFTGDGRADVAIHDRASGNWWVGRSTGAEFVIELWATGFGTGGDAEDVFVGDFTGDGRADVAIHDRRSGDWWIGRSTGTGFVVEPWATGFGTGSADVEEIFTGDFDGDGRFDVAIHNRQTGDWWVGRSTGAGFAIEWWAVGFGTSPSVERAHVADFTGDGRADVAIHNTATGQWWIGRSTGHSFSAEPWSSNFGNRPTVEQVFVADFTGDGRADVAIHRRTGHWWIGRSTGNDLAVKLWATGFGTLGDDVEEILALDVSGDGLADVVIHNRQTGDWFVGLSTDAGFAIEPWASNFGTRGQVVEQVVVGP